MRIGKRIDELIDSYINTINTIVPGVKFNMDEDLFDRMLDFIVELDPETLTDEQLDEVNIILNDLDVGDEDEEDVSEVKFAKRTAPQRRRKAKQYYRKNKSKIRRRKKVFQKSAVGRRRKKLKARMAKQNKSPTGRRKVRHRMM